MLFILDILILNQTFGNNQEIFRILAANSRKAANRKACNFDFSCDRCSYCLVMASHQTSDGSVNTNKPEINKITFRFQISAF